ncbi:MAG: hypothetical protein QM742_01965 [Aquabacterium sp.]
MTSPHWPQQRPFSFLARTLAGTTLAAAMACVPVAAQAAVPYTVTQTPYTPPMPSTGPVLSIPGSAIWGSAPNAQGDIAGTVRSDAFYEVFKAGPINSGSPDLAGYRFLGTGSNEFGTWATYLGTSQEAFVTRNGQLQRLGTLGFGESSARFINDRGQVAGDLYDRHVSANIVNGQRVANPDGAGFAEDRVRQHAFFHDGTVMKDLGTLGGSSSYVTALNNRGDVLGSSMLTGDQASQAFLYHDGVMTALGNGQNSYATLLNDNGTVAGGGLGGAFVYQDGVFHDLGLMGGTFAQATLLTSNNVVAGGVWGQGRGIFVYKGGSTTIVPTLRSADGSELQMIASSVNDHGDVLGFAFNNSYDEFHSFVYRDGEIVDLERLDAHVQRFPAVRLRWRRDRQRRPHHLHERRLHAGAESDGGRARGFHHRLSAGRSGVDVGPPCTAGTPLNHLKGEARVLDLESPALACPRRAGFRDVVELCHRRAVRCQSKGLAATSAQRDGLVGHPPGLSLPAQGCEPGRRRGWRDHEDHLGPTL